MEATLFVLKPFRYEKGNVDCSCHKIIRFQRGDQLHIFGEPFFVDHLGWYIQVQKNEEIQFYMSAHFIDDIYDKQVLCTKMDLSLAMNYHQYKIDEALKTKNEDLFHSHIKAYDQLKTLHSEHKPVKES